MTNADKASHAIAREDELAEGEGEDLGDAAAGDMYLEDLLTDDEEYVEAGPSGVQPPLVIQQAVCGGDDPPGAE